MDKLHAVSRMMGGLIMASASFNGCSHRPVNTSPTGEPLAVLVTADRPSARYLNGEKVAFTIDVTCGGRPASHGEVEVWLARDGGPAGIEKRSFNLAEHNPVEISGSVAEPCFYLCQAWASVDNAGAYGEKMVWYRAPVDTSQVSIELTTDRPDALYRSGEQAVFTARVAQNGKPLTAGKLELRLSREGAKESIARKEFDLSENMPMAISGTLSNASFLHCQARLTRDADKGSPVTSWISAGYDVDKIKPVTSKPGDFDAFWKETLLKARQLPADVKMEKMEKLSNTKATYYRFSVNTLNNERVYGFLGVPCGPGPFPVIAIYPGAGPGLSAPVDCGLTARGAIVLMMNVHKYPVAETPAEAKKQLEQYNARHKAASYISVGASSRDTFHFNSVLAGFCRSLDYICSRNDWWDGKHLVISGSSQGGFLTLAMSGLYADKVTAAMSGVPYLCDYSRTRQAGDRATLNTMLYYDPVNFAKLIRCPLQVSVAFADGSCPPATVFSAYNSIPRNDKKIMMEPRAGHGTTPERQAMERDCILRGLGFR
jgi:cephalosporin-C deacetylase-like acetyl esterase